MYWNSRFYRRQYRIRSPVISQWRLPTPTHFNPLTPNDPYRGRTAPLISKVAFYIFIQQIQVLNILKHGIYFPFFPLQNAICFIILTYLVPVLFTFYIFIQQTQTLNILNMIYTLRFFSSSKCSLLHNSNVFGSCIIHILYTGVLKYSHFIYRVC